MEWARNTNSRYDPQAHQEVNAALAAIAFEPVDWYLTAKDIYDQGGVSPEMLLGMAVPFASYAAFKRLRRVLGFDFNLDNLSIEEKYIACPGVDFHSVEPPGYLYRNGRPLVETDRWRLRPGEEYHSAFTTMQDPFFNRNRYGAEIDTSRFPEGIHVEWEPWDPQRGAYTPNHFGIYGFGSGQGAFTETRIIDSKALGRDFGSPFRY
jgi:hypothetical protein